jgi:hypothetical protein
MENRSFLDRFARIFRTSFDIDRLRYATLTSTVLLMSVAIAVLTGSITELNTVPFHISENIFAKKETLFPLMAAIVAIMTLFSFTLSYLNKKRTSGEYKERYSYFEIDSPNIRKIEQDIRRLKRLASVEVGKDSEAQIDKLVKNEIEKIAYKSIIESIKNKMESDIRLEHDIEAFSKSISRIGNEIESLKTRGNLNLTIGIMATIIGIIMLGAFVFTTNYKDISIEKFLIHFIPRISLVIFVQIFAFFFLKLYRSNMEEIKYFHNELTSIESRISAVVLAKNANNPEGMMKVITGLSAVDRNSPQQGGTAKESEQSIDMLTKLLSAVAPLVKQG